MKKFLKNSLFSRKKTHEERHKTSGVLAVWGSPNSGKSTLAVKLSKKLSETGEDTILLLCDTTAPMLPCIIPKSEIEQVKSMSSILSATYVNETLIKQNMTTLKKNKHLTMIGLDKGENEYSFPSYTESQARGVIDALKEIAPYIIIDCSSYIANDILSAVALLEADDVLRLSNCDLKSISYLSSQLPLLKDKEWYADKQYKVASNIKPYQASENINAILGDATFKLPYSRELELQGLEGHLFKSLDLKESRPYKRGINNILKEVFGI